MLCAEHIKIYQLFNCGQNDPNEGLFEINKYGLSIIERAKKNSEILVIFIYFSLCECEGFETYCLNFWWKSSNKDIPNIEFHEAGIPLSMLHYTLHKLFLKLAVS